MRGDRPELRLIRLFPLQFTPHARGSTEDGSLSRDGMEVYPACAGIDPGGGLVATNRESLPRMRGDRPYKRIRKDVARRFTPHARGSTLRAATARRKSAVYPACAGIDLSLRKAICAMSGLPRMRGDRPIRVLQLGELKRFTPHARGSTVHLFQPQGFPEVYPACAGIDRCISGLCIRCHGLPRMRGDRPCNSFKRLK